ncbi:MAG TPA: ribosome small subunit-dependent GTPase A [Clostridiales bacterium]|jgi:ribosome biogenesis GTPase|nr:ribosome small subunit-dependent GTPase A [Clostridiales bacterium]
MKYKDGLILKGIGGFYTVSTDDDCIYTCKARGRFRIDRVTPIVGDRVKIQCDDTDCSGSILEIYPRKSELVRPPVANIDKLLIVVSASSPKPDMLLLDKLLITCEILGIIPIIILNKIDEAKTDTHEIVLEYAPAGYKILPVSATNGTNIDLLINELENSVCCLTGQSAVGKTSIVNRIFPDLNLEVGSLSQKTYRGKHTTRNVELWKTYNGGAILDTPGFSAFEGFNIAPHELHKFYPEMRESNSCKFLDCLHINEPDCSIKHLIKANKLSFGRYERYKRLYSELLEAYKRRFD